MLAFTMGRKTAAGIKVNMTDKEARKWVEKPALSMARNMKVHKEPRRKTNTVAKSWRRQGREHSTGRAYRRPLAMRCIVHSSNNEISRLVASKSM